MKFKKINFNNWKRKEYFNHYYNIQPCSYNITVDLDITKLLKIIKIQKFKLYPAIIYSITTIINKHDEFKTTFNQGILGTYETMNPSYTIFHSDDKTFSILWSEYNHEFKYFYQNYLNDLRTYGKIKKIFPKQESINSFNLSCLPWLSFNEFSLTINDELHYLLPIFTIGKYYKQNDKILLPLSIRVHHALCDGYHVSRFINELQIMINEHQFIKE